MQPRMIVIAGPPGSGKSTAFPVADFGVKFFNADDRAAALNGGAYRGISARVRKQVNQEFEAFVTNCIQSRESFAIETTLRSLIAFDQAQIAQKAGFMIEMRYLALAEYALHVERIKSRADAAGHSASEATLALIYEASIGNLPAAIRQMDAIRVYDNTKPGGPPDVVLEARKGNITYLRRPEPEWLKRALSQFRGPA